MSDLTVEIASKVKDACIQQQPLIIKAGDTKPFYGRNIQAETFSIAKHTGVIEYEPSELYISARSGTSLQEIQETIAQHNQMLPCEPALFGKSATLGGMVACGLSGPRRPYAGSVRDCILGTEIINGNGDPLHFGGRVMKNVAGYDVSRLMCGALGTLGIITSVTIRLLPMPEHEETIALTVDLDSAIKLMNQWANTPMPISATFYDGKNLFIRLSSSLSAARACKSKIGGDSITNSETFWNDVKEHIHPFFVSENPLWRISVPPNTAKLDIPGKNVLEWNGALRWYITDTHESKIRSEVEQIGGHATLFKGCSTGKTPGQSTDQFSGQVFHPLSETSMKIHQKLKQVLDPAGILNPGKMFAEL